MLRLAAILLLSSLSCATFAQTSEADLRARLVNQPLYLRGQWHDDNLKFDAMGHPVEVSAPTSFALSGIDIESIDVKKHLLVIQGQRVGLEFENDSPKRVSLKLLDGGPERIRIEIEKPAGEDFTAPLDAIFTANISDFVPSLPDYWQLYAQKHLLPPDLSPSKETTNAVSKPQQPNPVSKGGPITRPQIIKNPMARCTPAACALKYAARTIVRIDLEPTGMPSRVQIVQPAGLGLDEIAALQVAKWEFKPAMQDGVPIKLRLNIELNFLTPPPPNFQKQTH